MSITVTFTFATQAEAAAFLAGNAGAAAAAPAPAAGKSKPAAETKPANKYTRDQMQAKLNELKEKKGAPAAKGVITETGGVAKMAEIPESKIDEVYAAADKALNAEEEM
jgi:hypothetical protein